LNRKDYELIAEILSHSKVILQPTAKNEGAAKEAHRNLVAHFAEALAGASASFNPEIFTKSCK
jgi:hypothetical protein